MTRVNRSVGGDISLRLQNLQLVVNSILHFYLTSQQQLVLAPLPDISAIAHSPDSGNQSLHQYIYYLHSNVLSLSHNSHTLQHMYMSIANFCRLGLSANNYYCHQWPLIYVYSMMCVCVYSVCVILPTES